MNRQLGKAKMAPWLLAVGFFANQVWGLEQHDSFSADVGMGFDWVGQKYRLSDKDTLDQFDERNFSASLSYGGIVEKGLRVEDKVTLSDHTVQNLLIAGWGAAIAQDALVRLENQLEFKDYWWRGRDLFGSGYMEDRLRIEGWWPLGTNVRLRADQKLTYVNYKKSSSYFRDSWLSESTARVEAELGWMWDLTFDYIFTRREVPDTSGMDYLSHSLATFLDGLVGWTPRLHLDSQLERRQSKEESRQDYLNLIGQGELEYELGSKISLVFRSELEQMLYDHPDDIYYDFWSAAGQLGLSYDFSPVISVALLPTYSRSKAKATSIGETYRQTGAELDLDYAGTGRMWANLALELGVRDYEEVEETSFYSNYTYVHPTLLLNYRLTDELSLDLFVDYDPEWHKQKEDDFTTSLISCNLSYRLR